MMKNRYGLAIAHQEKGRGVINPKNEVLSQLNNTQFVVLGTYC